MGGMAYGAPQPQYGMPPNMYAQPYGRGYQAAPAGYGAPPPQGTPSSTRAPCWERAPVKLT